MAKLVYDTPLSKTGVRLVHLDLTEALAYGDDTLTGSSPTVTSSDTDLVTISNVAVNASELTNDDGTTAAVGKAVQFQINAAKGATGKVKVEVAWAVSGGEPADTHEIELNLEPTITE